MKLATAWEYWVEERGDVPAHWEHHHLELGHADGDVPEAIAGAAGETQRSAWPKETWRKTLGTLDGQVFVR